MSLLSIEHATKYHRRGRLEHVAVRDISLEVEAGELVVIWGPRRSGRSTLLRIAAGIELPEEGTVRFEGKDLASCRDQVLGRRVGYCHTSFASAEGGHVIEHVADGLLALRASPRQARIRAAETLARLGAGHCGKYERHELDGAETIRVAIARALVTRPALLVIDDPANGVGVLERDPLLALLRLIANEGVAVLMSTSDAGDLSGADRALSIDEGKLRGESRPSESRVVPMRRATPPAGASRSAS